MATDGPASGPEKALIVVRQKSRRKYQNWVAKKASPAPRTSEPLWRQEKPLALKSHLNI